MSQWITYHGILFEVEAIRDDSPIFTESEAERFIDAETARAAVYSMELGLGERVQRSRAVAHPEGGYEVWPTPTGWQSTELTPGAALDEFLKIWGYVGTYHPSTVPGGMSCIEAEALAGLLRAYGCRAAGAALIREHGRYDDDPTDRHICHRQ